MKKSLLLAFMPIIVTTSCSNSSSSSSSHCYICIPPSRLILNTEHFLIPTKLGANTYSQSNIRMETNLAFYEKGNSDSKCPDYAMVYITKKDNSDEYSADDSEILFESSNKEELEKFYFKVDEDFVPENDYYIDENHVSYGESVELKLPKDLFTNDCGMIGIYFTFNNPNENSDKEITPDGSTSFIYRKLANEKINLSAVRCK